MCLKRLTSIVDATVLTFIGVLFLLFHAVFGIKSYGYLHRLNRLLFCYSIDFWELEASPQVVIPGEETAVFISKHGQNHDNHSSSMIVTLTVTYDNKINRETIHQKIWRVRIEDLIQDTSRFQRNSGERI